MSSRYLSQKAIQILREEYLNQIHSSVPKGVRTYWQINYYDFLPKSGAVFTKYSATAMYTPKSKYIKPSF